MGRFAENTSVSVEKSRAEIESILSKYGATHFGYATSPGEAVIEFVAMDRAVRFVLPLPDQNDPQFRMTPGRRKQRSPEQRHAAWEQACRQKWRALCLAIKAKLETVETGISTFEKEFLAHILIPGTRQTIGDALIPEVEKRYKGIECKLPLGLPAPKV